MDRIYRIEFGPEGSAEDDVLTTVTLGAPYAFTAVLRAGAKAQAAGYDMTRATVQTVTRIPGDGRAPYSLKTARRTASDD